jgi:HicA toxin of bacterial toxin-antitoxin,
VRIPRDVDGDSLAKALRLYDYSITRRVGNHLRMTTQMNGVHHVTVPRHDPLKVSTLAGIVQDVAAHLGKTRDLVVMEIFY